MFYESRLDTHDTHTRPMTRTRAVGWSRVARHRAPSRDAVRRPGRRSPPLAAGPRGILLFLTVRARVARRLRRVARRPSVTASIHPSVPHRTAKKPRVEGPPVEVESTFSPDRMARTDGTPPTDERDEIERNRTNEIERTNEGAREETARARRRDPAVSLPSSFLRSFAFVRSFASSRGACEPKSQTYRV